ncbi:MAG: hypothetical protein J3K34DRAFT_70515 [Monoraphidium minutum]|nr:MAG: hypothetical protein J3K34DRAFT_70515 [Monoraphidium minutum]
MDAPPAAAPGAPHGSGIPTGCPGPELRRPCAQGLLRLPRGRCALSHPAAAPHPGSPRCHGPDPYQRPAARAGTAARACCARANNPQPQPRWDDASGGRIASHIHLLPAAPPPAAPWRAPGAVARPPGAPQSPLAPIQLALAWTGGACTGEYIAPGCADSPLRPAALGASRTRLAPPLPTGRLARPHVTQLPAAGGPQPTTRPPGLSADIAWRQAGSASRPRQHTLAGEMGGCRVVPPKRHHTTGLESLKTLERR